MKEKIFQFVIFTAAFVLLIKNFYGISKDLNRFLNRRRENLAVGKEAFVHSPMLMEICEFRSYIPDGSRCFYWEIEIPKEGGVARECDAIKMNYLLYPRIVRYSDNILMLDADYIITQKAIESLLKRKLNELLVNSEKNIELEPVFIGNRYIVFKTNEKGE